MNFDFERVLLFLKKNIIFAIIFSLGMIFLGVGLIQMFEGKNNDIAFEKGSENAEVTKSIAVDIEGAVINPGVYQLSFEARVKDALVAAGGLSNDADRSYISQKINLAKKVSDGEKIYIPKQGEKVSGVSTGAGLGQAVSINTSTISELDTLPGIGQVTAQKIIDGRPYGSIDELLSRKIVSSSVFEKIKALIGL